MYITEAIEKAKSLHPNEYSISECIDWCNEFSAELSKNFEFDCICLNFGGKDEILLPSGIDICDILRIYADGKLIRKTDLQDYGYIISYGENGRYFKKESDAAHDIEIICTKPYVPIRLIDKDATAEINGSQIKCNENIFVGDTLNITYNGETNTIFITGISKSENNVFTFEGTAGFTGEENVHIKREITEKTLLPSPYDTAYIDFICAKCALYQGDSETYNTFAAQVIQKLDGYRLYLSRNMPRPKAKIYNWL